MWGGGQMWGQPTMNNGTNAVKNAKLKLIHFVYYMTYESDIFQINSMMKYTVVITP